jgi:hypothetical protein
MPCELIRLYLYYQCKSYEDSRRLAWLCALQEEAVASSFEALSGLMPDKESLSRWHSPCQNQTKPGCLCDEVQSETISRHRVSVVEPSHGVANLPVTPQPRRISYLRIINARAAPSNAAGRVDLEGEAGFKSSGSLEARLSHRLRLLVDTAEL